MNHYETVKKYYDLGVWSEAKLKNAVTKGWITNEEFKEITKTKEG